jgi:hypothetical protein
VHLSNWAGALSIAVAMSLSVADAGAQRRGQPRTYDARQPIGLNKVFYDMAGEVPGFAGFRLDSTGTVVISLTDPATHGADAIEVVRRYLEENGRQLSIRVGPLVDYNFRQLFDWKASYFVSPPSVGLTGADVCVEQIASASASRPVGRSATHTRKRIFSASHGRLWSYA